jgi:single-strand DNA-binding protein
MAALIIATGNVGRLETRELPDGKKVTNFSIASNEKYKGEENTTWINCVAFGALAEMLEQHLTKGQKVFVEGSMKNRSWDKDGVTHYRTECAVKIFEFLSPKNESQPQKDDFEDDEVPF